MPSKANSGWQHEKTGNGHIPHCHPSNNAQSSHSKASQSGATDEGDGDDGDGNGAEADELDEDDVNGDGMAPSGCTIDQDGKQAGHITGKSIQHLSYSSENRKRRLDTPDEATHPPKALKRTRDARQIDQSDDDDYNGVDLISDSGEEGQGIEQLEEMLIIESEEEYDFNATNVSQPPGSVSSDGEDWSPWALGRGLYVTDVPYFNDQIGRVEPSEMAIDAEIFRSASSFQSKHIEEPTSPKPRRVRFAEQAIAPGNRSRTNSVVQVERVTSSQRPENLDSEDSCGNSSGYESGFCIVQCNDSLNANNQRFQLILARLPKKRSFRVRSRRGRNYLCDVPRCRRRVPNEFTHQCLVVPLPKSLEIVAGAHAWHAGSPIRPSPWLSSTAMARPWSFALHCTLRKLGRLFYQLAVAGAAPRIRALVHRYQS